MIASDFFQDVFNIYSRIKIKKENRDFYKLNKIVYYLADVQKSTIQAKDVWEVDIQSAFPSICQFLFPKETNFLAQLNELKEKKQERNIFISTHLKDTEYLKQLNLISKMIISSVVMDADPNAKVLELKKDGIVFIGENVSNGELFNKFIKLGFHFHQTKYMKYIRFQRTSHFLDESGILKIKGVFKDRPLFLMEIAQKILNQDEIDFDFINKVYSKPYFSIIRENILDELFGKYFLCEGNKYLTNFFRYEKIKLISNIYNLIPKNYLKLFIFPLLIER